MNAHFKVLYSTFYPKVYANCMMILKNPTMAEEAAQEAFLKAYEKLDTLKDPNKFGPWVSTIATNQCKDIYNKSKKTVLMDKCEAIDYFSEKMQFRNDPSDRIERVELKNELLEAIDKLNHIFKQLIILKYYWELPEAEIAEMMGIPVGTVKSSLYRARKKLAKILPSINKDYLIIYLIQEGKYHQDV